MSTGRAGKPLREEVHRRRLPGAVKPEHLHDTLSHLERRLHRVDQPSAVQLPNHQPVHHDRHIVILPPVEFRHGRQVVGRPVHPGSDEPPLPEVVEQIAEFSLAAPHHRAEDLDPGALRPAQDGVGDLAGALARDRAAIVRAERGAGPGPQQPHVVVHLGHGPHRRSRVVAGGLLFNGNRGRQALDGVDVRLFHQTEELPGVGRQRLDVAPLALGVNGIEGERGFPRPREAGDHGQPIPGDRDRDVLEVVFAGSANDQALISHSRAR